jgi:capsular polysaccharide biosynthesis protein
VAIADTVKALATSPSRVQDALRTGGVTGRNAEQIAQDRVSVRALGSSGIVEISVTDAKAAAAALIANALAAEVIETRLAVTRGENQQALAAIDQRITRLNRRISTLDGTIATLSAQGSDNQTRSQVNEAESTRDFLARQRGVLEAQQVSLLSNEALRPKPSIIGRATAPKAANPSRWLPDLLLAAAVGFILGIGTAGLIETLRRTVTGGAALARAFDTPLLGTVRPSFADGRSAAGDPDLAVRLKLAAEAADVTDATLFPVGHIDTEALAVQLGPWAPDVAASGRRNSRRPNDAAVAIRPFGATNGHANGRDCTGLVVVSPGSLTKTELEQAVQLVHRTSLPLLGLIAVEAIPQRSARQYAALVDRSKHVRKSA